MDHAGPVDMQPKILSSMDVLPHPHIGLSTVSYLFGGQVTHRDSLGVEQVIRPGEVNWMTAGSGIAHSERFEEPGTLAGGALEMIQTWVALPERDEESLPTFHNYQPEALPVFTDKGIRMRLIAGNAYGLKNEVKTHSPLFYLHVKPTGRQEELNCPPMTIKNLSRCRKTAPNLPLAHHRPNRFPSLNVFVTWKLLEIRLLFS